MKRRPWYLLIAVTLAAGVCFASFAGANAPAGRYTVSNGIVLDAKTKLAWQQVAAPTSGTYTVAQANTYCSGLGASLGGTGWRLPTLVELQTIVDYSQAAAPLIDSTAFPSTPTFFFWSSTPSAAQSGYEWGVDFSNGTTRTNGVTYTDNIDVRCVH